MNQDPLDTETNDALRKARENIAHHAQQLEISDLKWLMSSARGRRIAYRLLEQAGVYRSSFNTNALQMSFSEGNRNAGLRLLAAITDSCPDRLIEMLKEAKDA